ncbi:hypothetical protein E5347_12170 [Clostridium sartagoforme]|uniref:ABC transporter permease n=1 Tax=Clostridium sartagoforme TaxID=84031 RepID=A0A4V3RKW8_9CLOT|nr:hypothetical protein [Clostridium sartagoforme]TGY41480.1 hypothetical protein E5347_12170 [Clostridium sartagoforme]
MKKYFNKAIFYQGDGSILVPLLVTYISAFIINLLATSTYFSWYIRTQLYNHSNKENILTIPHIFLFGLYMVVIYVITVGVFKRKKWSTLLAGPFSRMDIRKREFLIISMSSLVYIIAFLYAILRGWSSESEILSYIGGFYELVLLDTLKLICIAVLIIGVLALLDSIFSNIYYLFGTIVFSFIYLVFLYINFGQSLSYYKNSYIYGLDYIINGTMEYIGYSSIGNPMTNFQVIMISMILLLVGIVLIFISKKLTNKMLLEDMNEGIIFNLPKKIARFMIITFPGMLLALVISEMIDSMYFMYSLGTYKLSIIRLGIIIVVSIISHFILKKITIKPKEIYRL